MLRVLENQRCLGFLSVSGDLGYVMKTFENGYGDTKLISIEDIQNLKNNYFIYTEK